MPELPAKVQGTLKLELRGGRLGEIYETIEDNEVTYELDIVRRDQSYAMSVDADGTLLEVEMDLANTPAPVHKTVKAQIGDAEVEVLTKSVTDGEVIFDIEFTKNDNVQILSVRADGILLDQQMEIALADAPAPGAESD